MDKRGIILVGFAAAIAYFFYKAGLLGGVGLPTNFSGTGTIGSNTPFTPITDVPAGFQVAGGNESPVNSPVILSGLYVPPSAPPAGGPAAGGTVGAPVTTGSRFGGGAGGGNVGGGVAGRGSTF